jgi:hypothetical protein
VTERWRITGTACLLLALAMLTGVDALAQNTSPLRLALRPAAEAKLRWTGLVAPVEGDPDSASNMPAFGVFGIFISAARGVAADQEQQSAARKRQMQADEVLAPLRGAIETIDADSLWLATIDQLARARSTTALLGADIPGTRLAATDAAPHPQAWVVSLVPRFMLTARLDNLIVDAVIELQAPGQAEAQASKLAVRVISAPGRAGDAWKAADGKALKAEAATLLAHAVEIALWQAQNTQQVPQPATAEPPQRTHRYPLADELRAERGQLLREGCARLLIRTLRKALLSVPRAGASCEAPYRLSEISNAPTAPSSSTSPRS